MFRQSFLSLSALLFLGPAALGVTNESRSLSEVLENGTLSKSDCDRYYAGAEDEETMLRCGKFMYFYDSLGLPGFPQGLVDLLRKNAPETVGLSLEKMGLYNDPYSASDMPIGFVEGPEQVGWMKVYTPTCASCHFAKLPDGRYIVGQPNHAFEFGKLSITIGTMPELALAPKKKLPEPAEAKTRPIWDEFFKGLNGLKVIGETIKLLPNVVASGKKPLTDEDKTKLGLLPSGVLDGFAPPAYDDSVTVPQRILPLWALNPEGMEAAGATHGAMMTSSGGQANLQDVFKALGKAAVVQGGIDYFEKHGPEYWKPLEAYILSLKAPKNLAALDATRVAEGSSLFAQSCAGCHSGPSYAGTRVFDLAEIGTDPNQAYYLDEDGDMKAMEGLLMDSEMTGGVKANRFDGLWSLNRFLHNGSLSSLEQLFCLDGPRPAKLGDGLSAEGHTMTCDDYSRDEKLSLIEFLKSI